MIVKLIRTIIIAYATLMMAALVSIPVGHVIAPVWRFIHSLPVDITKYALEIAWTVGACLVLTWILEDHWPEAADQSDRQAQPSQSLLQDQAPWLQTVEVGADAASPPALSPPPKSLPAPAHD